MFLSGHIAGVQPDDVAPHSATAAHRTAPALSTGSACVNQAAAYVSPAAARVSPWMPDVPRLLSQPRVAVPESETAEHENLDGRRSEINFPGIIQEYNTMLLRPTPLQQLTRPLRLWPRALRVATPWSPGLLDSDTLELRRQLARLPSKIFYLDYGGLMMDRVKEMSPVPEVCLTL